MSELKLLTPTPEMGDKIMKYRSEYLIEMKKINGSGGLHHYENYIDYFNHVENSKRVDDESFVPSTQYFAFVDGRIVGSLQIRHKLNDDLLLRGGHIGYSVLKCERRKGYASDMLAQALEKCCEMHLYKVLLTCDKDNIASAKTIIKNGGILENELVSDGTGKAIQRYWISLPWICNHEKTNLHATSSQP